MNDWKKVKDEKPKEDNVYRNLNTEGIAVKNRQWACKESLERTWNKKLRLITWIVCSMEYIIISRRIKKISKKVYWSI